MSEHHMPSMEVNMYEYSCTINRPSHLLKPRLFIDGDQWCAFYGDDLRDGVAGFGKSPELAYLDFDKEWIKEIKPKEDSP